MPTLDSQDNARTYASVLAILRGADDHPAGTTDEAEHDGARAVQNPALWDLSKPTDEGIPTRYPHGTVPADRPSPDDWLSARSGAPGRLSIR
ncbi:hypothetical protein PV410_25050 [Streptomyces sp. PA03-5A]|nr:hypothetical protein [Streptomyces sp. PA03-5A]